MEDPEAVEVTTTHSQSPTEHSEDEERPADPGAPEVNEASGISPQEEAAARSPAVGVQFHSPKPTEGDEVDVLEPFASRYELHTASYSESASVGAFGAAYTRVESNQFHLPPEGSEALVCLLPEDEFERHSLPVSEYEQVLTLDVVQAGEEPHRMSTEDTDVLASETLSISVEHNAPMLLEGVEVSVSEHTSPQEKDMEASSVLTQGEAEPIDGGWKEEIVEPDFARVDGSDGISQHEIEMSRELVESVANEFAEEGVESAREDVEAACSGDIASENEFAVAVDTKRRGGRKRKRGRPSSKLQGARFPSQTKYEEEVCFICFDGGDLVVCDRRGCPKVYHPSCVNRKEAYFQSKGQWSCGWHLCSKCQKPASYKCYTCTYSLCKLCVSDEEFTCIRGNKGFCTACMTTILLMETNENANEKKDGIDFNDRSCWEYLFKDYWYELKAKLSMNLDELTKARTASKVSDLVLRDEVFSDDAQDSDRSSACHDESTPPKMKLRLARTCKISRKAVQTEEMSLPDDNSSRKKGRYRNATSDSLRIEGKAEVAAVHPENSLMTKEKKRPRKTATEEGTLNDTKSKFSVHKNKSSKKKLKKRSRGTVEENMLVDADKKQSADEYTDWASKELLEFVSHVKNGDKSILSPYEVQEILLDYIKVNKLRDPRKKSQIICDPMLLTLFDKIRVGHFEMLKLLEFHIFTKVSSPASDEYQGAQTDVIEMGTEASDGLTGMMNADNGQISRKRLESKPQTELYSYAAIDVHNINLMYLRRSLMEELIDDMSTFSEKVIGSFVRIRVTSSQKQEVYRLVQVVGCGKAPEEYKTGKRTTDVMLEIINLDKKEVITVDIISNQEFTEEECKRLRQSVKFGFISRLTVGEVQEKARVLQFVRSREHLESEKLRLTHLRDRASEKGRRKEHRECVEKLHLLSSPEEQMKRLHEVAQAHADPKMDPSYESPEEEDEDEVKEGNPDRPVQSAFKERELISPQKDGSCNLSGVPNSLNNSIVSPQINNMQNIEAKVEPLPDDKEPLRESAVLPEPKLEDSSAKVVPQPNDSEGEKIWHYKDPSGKIQGPFSVVQLRKWSKHFPSNLAIWRKSERQEDSILLTDALAGNFQKDLPEWVPLNSVQLSSPSPSIVSSCKIQENATLVQDDKTAINAACIDSNANLDNKHITKINDFYKISSSEQVVAHGLCSESTQQASYQLIDVRNRPPVLSSDLDPRKKFFEDPGTTCGNGDNSQKQDLAGHLISELHQSIKAQQQDKMVEHSTSRDSSQRQDLAGHLISELHHSIKAQQDKLVDHSTSSTESNTVPEVSQRDHTCTSFQKSGPSDVNPIVESKALENCSPQILDTSTFPKPCPETPLSAYPNPSIQNPGTSVNSVSGQPSHSVPQTVSPFNCNQPTNTYIGERSVPSLDSTTMLSGASVGVPASVNCQTVPPLSSDGTKSFSSPQLNNSMITITYQPPNMSWGAGTTEVNSPGWPVQTQFQNPTNMAVAVPNMLCGAGVQGGLVNNTSLGWGMMAQGNMTMPWAVPPNVNIAWNQGLALPPQGSVPINFIGPPPQGNVAPYPMWTAPVPQMNPNQNPCWPAPLVPNTNQIAQPNNATPRDPSKENPSTSNMQRERSSDRNFGSRDGGSRFAGPGYGSGRQPRNWMNSGNGDRSSRPPEYNPGICSFHMSGHCKKGASCNYIHT